MVDDETRSTDVPAAPQRSNRGFWLIAGGLLIAGLVIVVGALLTSPDPPSTSAKANLELSLRAARIARSKAGTYAAATADELGVIEVRLMFVPGDRPSTGPAQVSVHAGLDAWMAAALASNGGCRWIRVDGPSDLVVRGASQGVCSGDSIAAAAPSINGAP
jgi:hypothetical protein